MLARHASEETLGLRDRSGAQVIESSTWYATWTAVLMASEQNCGIPAVTFSLTTGLLAATPLAIFA